MSRLSGSVPGAITSLSYVRVRDKLQCRHGIPQEGLKNVSMTDEAIINTPSGRWSGSLVVRRRAVCLCPAAPDTALCHLLIQFTAKIVVTKKHCIAVCPCKDARNPAGSALAQAVCAAVEALQRTVTVLKVDTGDFRHGWIQTPKLFSACPVSGRVYVE